MKKEEWLAGIKTIFPVSISYIPLGLACGIVLQQSGFNAIAVFLASLLVYGGASQFLIASMTLSGAAVFEIITMVFFINLRHLLMSSTFAQRLNKESTLFNMMFAHVITDESFAVNTLKFKLDPKWTPQKGVAASITAWLAWVVSTVAGSLLGNAFEVSTVVMTYVLTAMFIYLLVSQMENKIMVWTGLFGLVIAVLMKMLLQNGIAILIASILASLFGLALEIIKNRKEGIVHES
ncbi:AzlC family ABC transporter permease [Jeotgalibaca sp. A127]|uniref:AzlC family ABC transporter permease n=1 Tax=Jeotgalibaca sp. A122 TaxID=3457322 RepID=UPI003FD47836